MMKQKPRIAVIGGDARLIFAAEHLAHGGCNVSAWGLCGTPSHVDVYELPELALENADAVLLPIPLSRDRMQVTGTNLSVSALSAMLKKGMRVFLKARQTSLGSAKRENLFQKVLLRAFY